MVSKGQVGPAEGGDRTVRGAPDRRTKWSPQATWDQLKSVVVQVSPRQEDQVVSAGQVAAKLVVEQVGGPSGLLRPSGDQPKSVIEQFGEPRIGGPSGLRRPSGDQPKSVVEKVRGAPDRRTKWCPKAKWRPAEVGGGEQSGEPPGQEDQVVSSGQVATHRCRWWRKSGSPRTGGPSGLLKPSGDPPMSVVEKVGEPPHRRNKCPMRAKMVVKMERSLAVGPLSVQQSYPAEGQVSGVPQACGGCQQVRESIDCCGSHGKGTMGDWWSSPPPFSTLTLHTRVLTSDSWPRRMRACFWCQLRNVKFRGSSGWSRTRAETPHSPSKSVWVVAVGQFG